MDINLGTNTPIKVHSVSIEERTKLAELRAKEIELEEKEINLQIKKQELENKKKESESLDLKRTESEYNIKDLKARIADRAHEDLQAMEDRAQQGRTFGQLDAIDRFNWTNCSHKKGGVVSARDMRALTLGGNKEQYAVIKHQMINGDIWVHCLRCKRTWLPPVESNYYFTEKGKNCAPKDGTLNQELFNKVKAQHLEAIQFQTNNTPSGSVVCRFSQIEEGTGREYDANGQYRENVRSSNLR